jgi:hypothetical protein
MGNLIVSNLLTKTPANILDEMSDNCWLEASVNDNSNYESIYLCQVYQCYGHSDTLSLVT